MTHSLVKPLVRINLLLLALASLAACTSDTGAFPRIANPPPFDFVDGQELRSRMHQLAFELQELDLALAADTDGRPDFQQMIVGNLRDIERIASTLQEGDLSSRHTFLQDGMDNFLADVGRARRDAEQSTPRYYMAGRVSGACVNCHRSSR
ncbi:MAG: hypothetical protein RLZZ385_367 [Pseudomonadota bacterium]|jgi:hypothetical protein